MTNFEYIKAMNIGELADYLHYIFVLEGLVELGKPTKLHCSMCPFECGTPDLYCSYNCIIDYLIKEHKEEETCEQ